MADEDIVELVWKSGQLVRQSQSQRQRPTSDKPSPPLILRGSGSGGGEIENAPLPQPHLPPPLPLQPSDQNLFIHEDEMASWLHYPYGEDYFSTDLLYSGVTSTPATHPPQSSISLSPPPPPSSSTSQTIRPNFMNFSRLIGTLEAGQSIPVARASTQVDSSATSSSSATESCLTPATESQWTTAHGFPVPGVNRKGKAVAVDETFCQIAGTSFSGTPEAETEPIEIHPSATETEFPDDRKREEKEKTIVEIEATQKSKEARGSTSRKRSRAAEMHNIAERRRREKINEKMKALQQIIPRCNKSDKASMLDDAIDYVRSLQLQIQTMSTGGSLMPMMYTANMQRFMPPFIPFPRPAHMAGVGPSYPAPPQYPFLPNIQTSDPSRVHLPPTQQLNPLFNQPQFLGFMNPYTQFVGLQQMQQPPPLQSQTSQLSFSQPSSSKQTEDQVNKPTGSRKD